MPNPLAQALLLPSQRDERLLDRVRYGQSLMQQGSSTAPVQSPLEGLARALQGGLGGYFAGQAGREGKERDRAYQTKLADVLRNPKPMEALAASDDPELQGLGLQYQLAQAMEQPGERWETLTDEEEQAMGLPPEGVYQRSSTGAIKPAYDAPKADKFKPNVQEFFVDGQKVKGYLDENNQLVTVGDRVPLYKPEGEGIQVDTNGDGIPDVTIGGKGMKPMSDAASQQTLRATLIDDATKAIGEINFDNVSAGKTAIGGWMSENPLGEMVAGEFVLNDDEKKLLGAQGMIQEAVISAITGSAYNEEQKRNMRAAMVPLATDGPKRKLEKLKAAGKFLKQLDKNSGYNRLPNEPDAGGGDLYDEFGLERPQ